MNIEARDPRQRYWVQSTKLELEGKLGTTFSLSNGMLGLRGAHEECPAWGRPEFYVAGTYATGPASLLGFHDPDHILTHPERMTPEALAAAADNSIQTLPNLPFPIALKIDVGGTPFTQSVQTLYALDEALDELFESGGVYARRGMYVERMRQVREALIDLGIVPRHASGAFEKEAVR